MKQLIFMASLLCLLTACAEKKPEFTRIVEGRTEGEYCIDCINYTENVLVTNCPDDPLAQQKMMLAYQDSVGTSLSELRHTDIEYYTMYFYKSSSITRFAFLDGEAPVSYGRGGTPDIENYYIGAVYMLRSPQKRAKWRVGLSQTFPPIQYGDYEPEFFTGEMLMNEIDPELNAPNPNSELVKYYNQLQSGRQSAFQDATPTDFTSPLRPGEKLQAGVTYTDSLTFLEYMDDGDYYMLDVQKGDSLISLINNDEARDLNAGDLILVQWGMDSIYIAGDNDALEITEFVHKISKLKDGKLSLFRKNNLKPIKYIHMADNSEWFTQKCTDAVDYFLANTTNETVLNYLKDGQGSLEIEFAMVPDADDESEDYPTVTAKISNYVNNTYTDICKVGIGFHPISYYTYNQQTDTYTPLKLQ